MQTGNRFGLSCALTLPCRDDLSVDYGRLTAQARRCLAAGCSSIMLFGTTGEGASLFLGEREQILDALPPAGIDLRRQVLGGVVATSVGGALEQARPLLERGCRGVLLAPPFYFKNVSDEGLYRWFSQLFEELGPEARDVFLYHIPSTTQVAVSIELIGRLKAAFPGVVAGVKDSGGDWTYTEKLLRTHADLILLIGDERHLAAGVRLGAQGAISGLANLCPQPLARVIEVGEDDARVAGLMKEVLNYPVTPAVKALLAHREKDPVWLHVRPPLVALSPAQAFRLSQAYDGFFS